MHYKETQQWRTTTQPLQPPTHTPTPIGKYDVYPSFDIGENQIHLGYQGLARWMKSFDQIRIDGYVGVFWDDFHTQIDRELKSEGIQANWIDIREALKATHVIDRMIECYLGGDDPIFGKRCDLPIEEFFNSNKIKDLEKDATSDITIIYGIGAALVPWDSPVVYIDVPKNEIQFRSRANCVTNFGAVDPAPPKVMYKRFYFVDWPVLNAHKRRILPQIDIVVDSQRRDSPAWMEGDDLRAALKKASENPFRPKPWFEPGAWGGNWMLNHIPQLEKNVPNYAWSFELISPENGLCFKSSNLVLEVSFDLIMFQESKSVLGEAEGRFGVEFPIRFDFLDTFDGGNLSVQCHPSPDYIKKHFGENFTQDETYYILDCKPGAPVYLGFKENIDKADFRKTLEESQKNKKPVDIEKFVQKHPAHKHDLFLIPHGTIHGSGINNMVLEISATPYIFTFKLYDWMRLDLDGNPRPINIQRGFDNLNFERKGRKVMAELISKPRIINQNEMMTHFHLPTHKDHFYDVERFDFTGEVVVNSNNQCHVLMCVEGSSIKVETSQGICTFSYAETFIIPASVGYYKLLSNTGENIKVVKAFVK